MRIRPRINASIWPAFGRQALGRPTLNRIAWLVMALLSPAAIYAQEAGAITGHVVSDDGKAVADVRVTLSAPSGDRLRAISRTTTTDEHGRFQFRNLPNRGYSIYPSWQKGYVLKPRTAEESAPARHYPGDSVTITMMRGGVITGRVTSAGGNPLINIPVAAIRVRDQEGNKLADASGGLPFSTDDRGVYRIYGLLPGTYVVVANSTPYVNGPPSPYYGDAPTYHPSSTRDTAAEVRITGGDEISGIDIRHRGEAGHAVSGKVLGGELSVGNYLASVALRNAVTGTNVGNTSVLQGQGESRFAIYGVTDGEYELVASRGNFEADEFLSSEPRRLTVKGADVGGVELRMIPMASVRGRVAIEKSPSVCDAKIKPSLEDVSVYAAHDARADNRPGAAARFLSRGNSPNEKGEFKISSLAPAHYRLQASSPNETLFVKSISGLTPSAAARLNTARSAFTSDLSRTSLPLKSGEALSGVSVILSDGGASLRGNILPGEGTALPSRVKVYLVPAEPAAAAELLRYAERSATNHGLFTFTNIAPGKYWLLARATPDNPSPGLPPQLSAWDPAERAQLRKDAEAAKNEIELKACQRVKDHVLRF